jgi:hypothetical protein
MARQGEALVPLLNDEPLQRYEVTETGESTACQGVTIGRLHCNNADSVWACVAWGCRIHCVPEAVIEHKVCTSTGVAFQRVLHQSQSDLFHSEEPNRHVSRGGVVSHLCYSCIDYAMRMPLPSPHGRAAGVKDGLLQLPVISNAR